MAKCDNSVQGIEDDTRVNHLVVIELSEILDLSNTSLIEPKVVLLKPKCDIFEHVVDDPDRELLMVSVQSTQKYSKQVDIAELDFPRLAEDLL